MMHLVEIKRYSLFTLSLALFAVGAALCMRADLGIIPSLCPPYVLSCIPGQELSVGTFTMIMYLVFVAIQAILLRSDFSLRKLLQIPLSIVVGIFMDLAMLATQSMQWSDTTAGYTFRIVQTIVGISILLIGYVLQRKSRENKPDEGLVQAFAKMLKADLTIVILVFDVSMLAIGLIFCIFYFGNVHWNVIGAGTLLAIIVRTLFNLRTARLMPMMWNSEAIADTNTTIADGDTAGGSSFPLVVTIARMHGSGGHDIGYMVAERLGINFYDKEIISETAEKLGLDNDKVAQWDQEFSIRSLGRDGVVFAAQSQIIRDAAKESCVIIGRCADYVLRGRPYCLNIFIRSDEDYAVTLIRNKDNLSESQAREVIRLKNNARERHYAHYTHRKWQDPNNYDLVINTAKIGVESAVDIICNAVNNITGAGRL
ncbi:MAG: cytidylate kinase family protein [Bacteroidales bacterium]|nr:cytidylate kinase family protein [Bacteroidales bacterium]